MKRVFDEARERGLIVLTHRLVGMESYDEILVLSKGEIAERGNHLELMNQKGKYRQLYELQSMEVV